MKKINLSLLSTLVLFTALTAAEASPQDKCPNSNEPVVLSSCVSFETPDVEGLYENASCSIYDSSTNYWSCYAGNLQYTKQSTLYFPGTGATVIKKIEEVMRLASYGTGEEVAKAKLKPLLAALPQSVLVTQRCKK